MTMAEMSRQIEPFVRLFGRFEAGLNGGAAGALHAMRREAIERFSALGFPTTRNEEWRFTNVLPLLQRPYDSAPDSGRLTSEDLRDIAIPGAILLVLVNGVFAPEWSTTDAPPGVTVSSLRRAAETGDPDIERLLGGHAATADEAFTALNTAFLLDGGFVRIADNTLLETPVQIIHLSVGSSFIVHPRTLIVAGRHSAAHCIETFAALDAEKYFTNAVSEVIVGENARIEHTKFQNESASAAHIGTTHFTQERSSVVVSHVISFGAALARNDIAAILDGEGIATTLYGLSMAAGGQHVDNHTVIDHRKPHCTSVEVYRGILDDDARGVFSGKIIVRPDAQKTDARQSNKNLLLSDRATIDSKPQLEIHANDVKCAHGATVGQLDEEQLFYLRTRGIPLDTARMILTHGFADDLVNRIEIPALRATLERLLTEKLQNPIIP